MEGEFVADVTDDEGNGLYHIGIDVVHLAVVVIIGCPVSFAVVVGAPDHVVLKAQHESGSVGQRVIRLGSSSAQNLFHRGD